jgi:hypothetical protein
MVNIFQSGNLKSPKFDDFGLSGYICLPAWEKIRQPV